MDLIHMFLNLVAPPFTFFSLCFFVPPFYLFKSFLSLLATVFSEDVAGKVVLITGASSGIGEHLAYEYAKRGACLVLGARREKSLHEVAETARYLGSPDVIVVRADVARVDDCKRLVDAAIDHFGRLDHLVNNAGISSACMLEDTPDITAFRPVMDINFWGSIYTTRFAVPHLRNTNGTIVVLSSAASWLPMPRMNIYNASKAALLAAFETLRIELGPEINVTIVTPGYIESELTMGKFFTREGKMEVDQDLRDVQISAIPVASVRGCAKAIVNGACRGDRYVTQPSWLKMTYLWKVFCPEIIELGYRFMYLSTSPHETLSKNVLDYTGAKSLLYPPTIQLTSEIKTE